MKLFLISFFFCWPVVLVMAGDGKDVACRVFTDTLCVSTDTSCISTVRPRVGLVLSGGGAKGMAHVGALKVIEELGIPIDYIAGTSMGSIVGGMYALGYTSVQLENYIRDADWENLLTDRVQRRHVSIYEKGERKRYWLQFPTKGRKFDLPLGILTGQNISNLFTQLASPAYAQTDFSKLTIPFVCVATDIETGASVVIEQGNLVKAMRASMAIPSVFIPETIDGKRLYDGGLTNNLPADLLRDKGIDILIGIDVTSQPETTEINNIYQVMEQVVFMSSLPLKEANKKLCKILITPDISEYSASSFSAVDSLIVRGERAARLHEAGLRALADSLRSFEPGKFEEQSRCPQPLHSFYVKNVQIYGLKHTSKEFLLQKLELDFPGELTFAQLDQALEKVKGTQVFRSIVYQLNPLPNEKGFTSPTIPMVELQFNCIEYGANVFRIGMYYDKEYQAALLLNLSLSNVLLNNSKTRADLSIGENPTFSLSFFHSPALRPVGKTPFKARLSPDWQFNVDGYQFEAYNYSGNRRTTAYTFSNLSTGFQLLFTPTINSVIGGGLIGEYSVSNVKIGSNIGDVRSYYLYLIYRLFYERDTYNEDYFPTRGYKYCIEGTYNKGFSENVRYSDGFIGILFRSNFAFPMAHRWTLHTGIDAGSIFGANIPQHYMMWLGGMPGKHLRNDITFVGMHFMQEYNQCAWAIHLNNQVRLWNNIYVTARTNLGKTDSDAGGLITFNHLRVGCGVSVQYNSVIGPLGFTFASSNLTQSLLGAINFGFWF